MKQAFDIALQKELDLLQQKGNLRTLPRISHNGHFILRNGQKMLNLSSNDYLGLAEDYSLQESFLNNLIKSQALLSASSSRSLTGSYAAHELLETQLACLFGTESALVFNSGYHMNTGILPAICNAQTLILADRLVHASLIDGIRLSGATFIRYRHNDPEQLETLLAKHHSSYERIVVVTESIFSMDGDVTDLKQLVELKKLYNKVLLYVDEAHAVGVRGTKGLGCAEEQNCIGEIDFLTGTFGKALASVGGYVVCRRVIRDYLINKMRTFLFTTALPPLNLLWTHYVLEQLPALGEKRKQLRELSAFLKKELTSKGYHCPSDSHILPVIIGESQQAIEKAELLQRKGFYLLPVRPPTVPEGTARLRISLCATTPQTAIDQLIQWL